ncbi:PREDICTED: transient receptor potential cation channel trpm isoform X1 [Papilio polytes]|uniref:transient receptor potential cation channel trpm isoform X1 n=1 Tax=Papilio polytes TaxID=76194 RepID=UPI0006768B39|nr:PREDICTED: transient receptor potential cation channel trpm isoform X1 [Papilio polytes]
MSIQKCLLDNSSRMIKAMSTAKSNNNEVKTGVQSGLKKVGLAMLSLSIPVDDKKKKTTRSWIESTFQKRECKFFVPSAKDEHVCWCGLSKTAHGSSAACAGPGEAWVPARHTQPAPTDAYGTVEFQGGPHPTKAQYVRLSHDTRPDLIVQLLTREWALDRPKLLITIQGGKANFDLQPKLKKVLRKGLLKAAKTTGAWIFTGGTNTGVTRQVGDALQLERSQRAGRVVSIGIAPWGIVEGAHELIGRGRDVPYHAIASPRSKLAVLNNRHAYFLLVDNGSVGRYGAEIVLRRKLEKYIAAQKLHPYTHSSTPVVCLVIEGGTNTVRAVLEYVTDSPPVPVVVCDGSGRAADLIAFVHKYASESGEQTVLESMRDYLIGTIQKTFEVGLQQAECLYSELLQCTRKKNLITVFRIQERAEGGEVQELDQVILTALFRAQHLSPSEQLSLALTWNRVDIARSEIFVYGQEWPPGALDEAMMQALEHDRIDFVKLLLENGVSMRKFLTIPRLEELYNTKSGPSNTLRYILRDVRPHLPRGYVYTLHDIGLVINKLMGGAYRCYYTRRKFRPIYAKVMNKSVNVHRNSASFTRHNAGGLSLITGFMPVTSEMALFDYPFNELLMWAVLTKRHQMALLMWTHGEEALAKSLVACKLYKAMAHEAAEDDMETEVYEELRHYGKEFETKALELLDYCYRQDDDQAQQLLTCELQNWSGQTCLSLAVAANHRALLAHPCSQIILADLWMGGLRTRKNTNLKVILSLLFPLYILHLEFKSKEELQLMPQTEEEHLENESMEDDRSTKDPNDAEALIGSGAECETRVDQNGKVGKIGWEPSYRELPEYHAPEDKRMRPLRLRKKIYEFFTAPITKFWADSIAYILFLLMFTYTVLVKMDLTPSWPEIYSICYILTFLCEKIREIITSEPVAIRHKFSVWAWNMWNMYDAGFIIFFLVGLALRLRASSMDVGRVIYCVDIIYWYLRILNILGVNKYLGPLVTMMGKMVKNMIYFVVLLLVVLMSFGVARQAILYPDKEASLYLIREVFFQPYFMLYGEVFAEQMAPPCGLPGLEKCRVGHWVPPVVMSVYLLIANILLVNLLIAVFNNIFIEVNGVSHQIFFQPYFMLYGEVFASDIDPECGMDIYDPKCVTGRWITPIAMTIYLLVANILLINLLIAVFNNIFNEVNEVSHQVWMFQRFTVVMEYEQKPVLPPPLIIFCHIYATCKWVTRNVSHKRFQYDNGLKLFLEKEDMERLYDFEEECVEGYFREQEVKLSNSIEERVRNTTDRVEHITTKMEDLNQKANCQIQSVQSVEFRLRKLEDVAEQTMNHLAVIHRFMATHPSLVNRGSTDTLGPPPPTFQAGGARLRTASDRSEVLSDSDTGAARFAVRPVQEEDEQASQPSDDELPQSGPDATAEKEQEADSISTSSAGSVAGPDVTVIRPTVPATPARQRSSDSNRTEPSDEKKTVPSTNDDAFLPEVREIPTDTSNLRPRTTSAGTRRTANTRRRSEGGNDCGVGGHHSAQHLAPRRQHSQTHSEPDNSAVDACSLHNSVTGRQSGWEATGGAGGMSSGRTRVGGAPRSLLLAMHEYTSITDELETVYGLFSPPHTPRTPITSRLLSPARAASPSLRRRHASEMSNPEFALFMEKEHLRGAEEDDYIIMENLIQRRIEMECYLGRYEEEEAGEGSAGGEVSGPGGEVTAVSISVCVNNEEPPQNSQLLTVADRRLVHQRHSLRRSSAIDSRELPSPLQPLLGDDSCGEVLLPVPRQPSGETNASSDISLSHMVSENLPPRPSIVLDSSQLPRQRSAERPPAPHAPPAHARPETMC